MNLEETSRQFENLEQLCSKGVRVTVVESKTRGEAYELLTELFKQLREESSIFDSFLGYLARLHWSLRGYLATPEASNEYWTTTLHTLQSEFRSVGNYANADIKRNFHLLESKVGQLATDVDPMVSIVELIVTGEGKKYVAFEKVHQVARFKAFLGDKRFTTDVQAVLLKDLANAKADSNSQVFVLAAPRKIDSRHLRRLLLGGSVPNLTFVSPNWLAGNNPSKFAQNLALGLDSVKFPEFIVEGPVYSKLPQDPIIEEFETAQVTHSQSTFEIFHPSGDAECRLIRLSGGFVVPVEATGSKISILEPDSHGQFRVSSRDPFSSLAAGDILFELKDGSEEKFLLEAAASSMGIQYSDFEAMRLEMFVRLRSLITERGFLAAISFLQQSGVSTASHVDEWLGNANFISPRSISDRRNLAQALNFTEHEVNTYDSLATNLRSNLISIGHNARQKLAEELNAQEIERIDSGQIVTKILEEHGDAVFVLGKVQSVDSEITSCDSNDIRKVMKV